MGCNKSFHSRLFAITRHMRESDGGEVACCGSFLPKFVSQLPDNLDPISDSFSKSLNKVLKAVIKGTRIILREAAELQLGPCGIILSQTAITSFFKPVNRKTTIRKRRDWSDKDLLTSPSDLRAPKNNGKNKVDLSIAKKNIDLRVEHIFTSIRSGGKIYWEFKAG